MKAKDSQINIKVSKNELATIRKSAEKQNVSVSQYIRSKACSCGESGYEGIFTSVTWTCGKCGKTNVWRKHEKPN